MNLKDCRVLVTPTSFGKSEPRLTGELEELVGEVIYNTTGKPLSSTALVKLLPDIDGYIAGLDTIDREALAAANRLKVIARYGVGVDNVDLTAAEEKDIVVTNTPNANSVSVAELTVSLILTLARQIPEAVSATRQGGWPRFSGVSLEGKTVGILGLGAIGKQLVRRLVGFDCRILAYDPFADQSFAAQYPVLITDRVTVVEQADFLSLHLPLLPETRGMVDDAFLACMKPGSFLINTSRGEVVNEQALLRALESGRLRGAALDAFAVEPPPPDHPLLKLPQVIVTPHMGAHTDGSTNSMGWMSLRDCLAVLRGELPAHRVQA